LRDLGSDRVSFRHDVLREWAIANLIHSDPTMVERLSLDRPAPASLARGIELAARMHLERSADSKPWQSLVERLSEGAHGSWRRAVLLALVRSEVGPELLTRASGFLLANRASMLRELIRIVMAVDVEPASKLFASVGVDPAAIPAGLYVPSGASWYRLISWLLSLKQGLPVAAIPEVVDLYTAWSIGVMGLDPLTPLLLQWLYRWLTEIETARDAETFSDWRAPFGGELDSDRFRSLESDLRSGFLLFCNRMPGLAVEYLRSLSQRRRNQDAVRSILKFRGSLAQAAPAELAELTASALIPKHRSEREREDRLLDEPFDYVDHKFIPASPAQGPFLELLTHAPQHGLSLINRLINHAILFYTRGRDYGANAITISSPDGDRTFPWMQSYGWSREWAGHGSVTSGLMALEAWAHHRIEAGEALDTVLTDVLGPRGSPAAYVLVTVDLVLSHWPKTRETAVPFLACPELLCIDRDRHLNDNLELPDYFGFKALQKEPVGAASQRDLRKRVSRRVSLDELLGKYAFGPDELRERLAALLHRAAARLGPPDEQSDLRDPNFMVVHALNLVDPNNWREVSVALTDDTQVPAHEYVSPAAESKHLAALQEAARDKNADRSMQAALGLALEDPSRSSPTFAAQAVTWAQGAATTPKSEDADENWMREQAVVTAAMVMMRDGGSELRKRHREWARSVFAQALQTKEDPVYRFRSGLRYNPIAIAFAGMAHSLKDRSATGDLRALLEIATRDNPAAAHGFGAAATTLASVDERLPRSALRCAFAASIRSSREWDLPKEEVAARSERKRQRVEAVVDAELAWLAGERPEPDWPAFPSETARARRGVRLRLGRGQQDRPAPQRSRPAEYTDHQAAALWLKNAVALVYVVQRPWIREVLRTYTGWTAGANGAGLNAYEEIADPPSEWNDAYFDLLARNLPGLDLSQIEQLALGPVSSMADESFFDVITQFLRSVDGVYFNDRGLQELIATSIRSALADRLMASGGWKRLCSSRSTSIEIHIGPAIAVLFFNDYGFGQATKCYLLPGGIDRVDSFLPVLEKLVAQSGTSLFIAVVTLNLLEVSPRSGHLAFMVAATNIWLESHTDDSGFWVDNDIGHRVCVWLEKVWRQAPALLDADKAIRIDVDRLLAALVSFGVADARRLEEALAGGLENGA
jgi:hypothetical protein